MTGTLRGALLAGAWALVVACSGSASSRVEADARSNDGLADQAASDAASSDGRDGADVPSEVPPSEAAVPDLAPPEGDRIEPAPEVSESALDIAVVPEVSDVPDVPDVPDEPDAVADPGPEAIADLAEPDAGPACPTCAAYGAPVTTGAVGTGALFELSGLGASRLHPGVFYAHADSGDSARFFAFALDGTSRGEFHLAPDPGAIDWEDLSMGPCDAGWCLYLGDIGDNLEGRSGYVVYVVPEPVTLDAAGPLDVAFTALPFRYPDGSHNSETLLVHPVTGDVYPVRKAASAWGVYKLPVPHTPGQEAVLVKVGTVPSPGFLAVATGGDIHPCGDRVLLRSYGQLVELRLGAGQTFDQIFGNTGVPVPVASEPQGEAACYDAEGLGYVTVSEGAAAPIHVVGCGGF